MSFPRLGLRRKNDLPPRSLSSPTDVIGSASATSLAPVQTVKARITRLPAAMPLPTSTKARVKMLASRRTELAPSAVRSAQAGSTS
jgi:hypothetical protein